MFLFIKYDRNHIIVSLLCDHMNISENGCVKFIRQMFNNVKY